MTIAILAVMTIMFFYTLGFSITLWKGKSKTGSISVFILATSIVIIPFFTVLKF